MKNRGASAGERRFRGENRGDFAGCVAVTRREMVCLF